MVQRHTIECEPIHPTFGAECKGVDFSQPIPEDIMEQIHQSLGKYGVLVFRNTGMSDEQFVQWGSRFGEIAEVPQSRRFPTKNLSDPSNLYLDGSIVKPGELRWFLAKETGLFHVDTSYDARRVRLTSIIARELPPAGTGGATEFGDTRTAYDDLDEETKQLLVEWRTWVANLRGGSAEIPQGRLLRSQMSDSLGLSERPFTPFSSGINSRQTCTVDSTTP